MPCIDRHQQQIEDDEQEQQKEEEQQQQQFLVSLPLSGKTRCFTLPTHPHHVGGEGGGYAARDVVNALLDREGALNEAEEGETAAILSTLALTPSLLVICNGKSYHLHEHLPSSSPSPSTSSSAYSPSSFPPPLLLRLHSPSWGLKGGKGGFGAMLRSMGKGAGVKKTTDFGACRDLYGRRLRHVNDEIRLKKWLEDKEKEEEERDRKRGGGREKEKEKERERTASGIDGWYLSVPSWADIKKPSDSQRRKPLHQTNLKTVLCQNWLEARMGRRGPPPGAPIWWGCAAGRSCSFAHGEEELRGEGKEALERLEKERQEAERAAAAEAYMGSSALAPPVDMENAVMEGLRREAQARKKGKAGPLELHPPYPEEGEGGREGRGGGGDARSG